MKKNILITITAVSLIAAALLVYSAGNALWEKNAHRMEAQRVAWDALKVDIKRVTKDFKGETAMVIKDLNTGREIAINKDVLVPSASIVKIPVMMACFYADREGRIKLSDKIKLTNSEKAEGSGSLKNAPAGSFYTIEELMRLMITESDNTAANILIEALGFDDLNNYFARIGLKHTNLVRKMMDFRLRKNGVENYTTAEDMAYAIEKLYHGRFLSRAISDKCLKLLSEQKIKDRIPKRLPADTPVAHKTGLENGVCHDVGIVYTPKGNFLICVLTKHEYTTARPTKNLIARISLLTYNYYSGL